MRLENVADLTEATYFASFDNLLSSNFFEMQSHHNELP
jgi:hypothetical protein